MKKRSLALMSILFLCPLVASEVNTEEKVLLRPIVANLSQKVALQGANTVVAKNGGVKKELSDLVTFNVGCSLPLATHILTANGCQTLGVNAYIRDMAAKLENESNAVVTIPASYDVVFTDGSRSDDEVYAHIREVLNRIGRSEDIAMITDALAELKEVKRATFVRREECLVLLTDARALRIGESIFRKTPEGVVTDTFHSEEEYLIAFKNAGLVCKEVVRPSFYGEIKWKAYNDSLQDKNESLGAAYIHNNPFTLFHVVKKA